MCVSPEGIVSSAQRNKTSTLWFRTFQKHNHMKALSAFFHCLFFHCCFPFAPSCTVNHKSCDLIQTILMTGQQVIWQLQKTFYESVTSSLIGSRIYSCLCTLVWLCWCCAITGPHVLKLIKFSDKLSKWNMEVVVCLQRRPVQRLETSRNLGLSGAGPPGDIRLAPVHCIWGHPLFVSPFNPQYVLCYNIPHRSSVLLNLLLSSETLFYLQRSGAKSSLGVRIFHLFPMPILIFEL